jgi:hypothetical protein
MSLAPRRLRMTTRSMPASVPDARVLRIPASILLPIFTATLFISAFLMFLVEPMVAKVLLPVLGGAPMVWNTCVVFFQIMLLAGYGYAYGTSRWLDVVRHRPLHLVIVLVPLTVLPFATRPDLAPPIGNPVLWLLVVLAAAIGLPFFALSTSASVLQHWFTRTDHAGASDPYFLYAASNLGSLLALAAYPAVVEPMLGLGVQSRLWAIGYMVFAALTCACGVISGERTQPARSSLPEQCVDDSSCHADVSTIRRVRWTVLSFVPSSLMLAVTSYLSTDIAAVPLLWVIPLSIYLVTFVLAFSAIGERARAFARRAAPILVVALAACMVSQTRGPLPIVVSLHLATFAALALQCHSELAYDRPPSSRLTEFYFWISLGGMLGGLFNTLLAPIIFSGIVEYPLVLVLACVCGATPAILSSSGGGTPDTLRRAAVESVVFMLGVGAVTLAVTTWLRPAVAGPAAFVAAIGVLSIVIFAQRRRPLRFAAGVAGVLVALGANPGDPLLHAERTFFGVYRVMQDAGGQFHALAHGTTLHGMQSLDPARRREPLIYFHRTGPFGQAFTALPSAASAREIAVIGLGVGTLGAYAQPGQRWTFYEIDPAVERIARTTAYFSYLDDCGSACRVVLGDARLSLLRGPSRLYDVVVLDAFSSDAIPMHLLTREALSLYLSRLAPGGALIFHISNRHLKLGPVLARLAASLDLVALEQLDLAEDAQPSFGKRASDWMVMARRRGDLGPLASDARWFTPQAPPDTPLWTDDFSNILSVLRFR